MKLAYFDCFSGISGDMTLGALVDAGCPVEHLRSELHGLQVPGWELSAEKVWKNGMAATYVKVRTEDQQKHRSLSGILEILKDSKLAAPVRDRASAIFTKLGQAEARVHDVPLEKIHFHEVGAVDAIVDIVGACIGFHFLGIERFACSALNVGGGTAKMAHGVLPVPAPATANLLQGKPTYSNGVQKELVTPTGAAIVATLCDSYGPQPAMSVNAIGYGAGTADLEGQPNVLRLMVGEAAEKAVPGFDEEIAVIEANLDDMNLWLLLGKGADRGRVGRVHDASADEKESPRNFADRFVQATRHATAHVADFRRNHDVWRAHVPGTTSNSAARIRQRLDRLWRRAHQDFAREWPHPARRARI